MIQLRMAQDRLELKVDAIHAERVMQRVTPELQLSTQPPTAPLRVEDPFSNTENVRLSMSISRIWCATGCICICHRRRTQRTPQVLDRVFGILLVGYTGIPRVTPHCDSTQCVQRSAPTVLISYFFPLWLIMRALYIVASLSRANGPQLIIRVPHIVSESSQIFILCQHGDTRGVRERIQRGLASTHDTVSLSGATPLHVSFRS